MAKKKENSAPEVVQKTITVKAIAKIVPLTFYIEGGKQQTVVLSRGNSLTMPNFEANVKAMTTHANRSEITIL